MGTGAALYDPASKNFPSTIMAMGVKRALPLGEICTNPMARGPLTEAGLWPNCDVRSWASTGELESNVADARMTANIRLRYNQGLLSNDLISKDRREERRGE